VGWIKSVHNRIQWWALANNVMNIRISLPAELVWIIHT
jgi:hypothetical protein